MMKLQLLTPEHLERKLYVSPYTESDDFNEDWWQPGCIVFDSAEDSDRFQILLRGVEVGRIMAVDDGTHPAKEFGVPAKDSFVHLPFIETAESWRRQGLATQMLRLLREHYQDRNLMAFSEGADDFWDSTAWERFEHCEAAQSHQTLYISWAGQTETSGVDNSARRADAAFSLLNIGPPLDLAGEHRRFDQDGEWKREGPIQLPGRCHHDICSTDRIQWLSYR